jgi:hypothetical protein
MESKHIEQLLEKYWNCDTSLEEEQQLRDYFRGENVPGRWKEASELFRYFEQQRHQPLTDQTFDADVLKKIRKGQPVGKVIRLTRNVIVRIAAGLIVVIAATFFVRQELRKSYPPEDTFSDPRMAFEETKKALMMISKGFGKGQKEASKIKLFHDAEQKVQGRQERITSPPAPLRDGEGRSL